MTRLISILTALVASLGLSPLTARITDLNRQNDVVTVQTATGHIYRYYGCEDYETGDYVTAILWNAGTPNDCTDDAIIAVHYSGYSDYAGDPLNH